jgi:membrane-bound lytic murein transglycosylase D
MPKKISLLLLGAILAACSPLPDKPSATTDTYSLLRSSKAQSDHSSWYFESLALCQIHDTELEDFSPPVKVDIWDRVRDGFRLEPLVNRRIQQEIDWYAKHPAYMARVSERAEKYLFYIVEEIEKREMPMELALLPIVESAFDPFAFSHGRASGMWQFVPGTGKMFGLKQNWWYDGRRDVVASTDAALDYLEQLYKQVGNDWMLALAAYNSGIGNVQRAARKNADAGKALDYWSLHLPNETEMYVPRLLALKALVEQPDVYGLSFYPVPNEPYFLSVDVGSQIDLAQAADWAGISMEEFSALNPGFNRWATDPDGPHQLLFPRDKAGTFIERLASVPEDQRVVWDRYTIKPGDTLSSIAKQHRTTIEFLQSINTFKGTSIRVGKTLLVPKSSASTEHYTASASQRLKQTQAQGKGQKVEYTVKSGDSLWSISRQNNVTTQQLAKWNGMAPGDTLRLGQKLVIWQNSSDKGTAAKEDKGIVKKVGYKVRKGDSLAAIADKFNLRVADIVQWNRVNPSRRLQPGDSLTLFVDITRVQ